MSVKLAPLGTLRMKMHQEFAMRNTPVGSRVVVGFSGIRWEGDQISATQKGTLAGDWLSVGPDGTAVLEIRFCVETADSALIYVRGSGRADAATFNEGSPIFFSPLFETSHPDYLWLNRVAAVAKGIVEGDTVTFEVYEVQ